MTCGIYRIEVGPHFYYGSSKDLRGRERTHRTSLRRGEHHNVRMQNSWNKYQEFSFSTVLECSPSDLLTLEQGFLDQFYGNEHCLNLAGIAGSPRGYKHTPEAKARITVGTWTTTHGRDQAENQQEPPGHDTFVRDHRADVKA